MRAADFHPTSSTDVSPACSEDRWQAIALAYRQLASGQRLLLEERADAGEILVDSALRRLAKLGIEKVFAQDPGACGPSSTTVSPSSQPSIWRRWRRRPKHSLTERSNNVAGKPWHFFEL